MSPCSDSPRAPPWGVGCGTRGEHGGTTAELRAGTCTPSSCLRAAVALSTPHAPSPLRQTGRLLGGRPESEDEPFQSPGPRPEGVEHEVVRSPPRRRAGVRLTARER